MFIYLKFYVIIVLLFYEGWIYMPKKQITTDDIKDMLNTMTDDLGDNINSIKKLFGSLDYVNDDKQSILHILVDKIYDEKKCKLAIKALLKNKVDPNLEDFAKQNFIQTALYTGYSENFIFGIILESLDFGLNVNHVDFDGETIVHSLIYSDAYTGGIGSIYGLLLTNKFDSSIKDNDGFDIVKALDCQGNYSQEQIERVKKLFTSSDKTKKEYLFLEDDAADIKSNGNNNSPKSALIPLSDNELEDLEEFGVVLNTKDYTTSPAVGREKELKNIMVTLAQKKKSPIIVGESGVGKTALVEELAYRIQNGQVPKFLQNKIILEVTPSELVSGCEYVGSFEEQMKDLMELCEQYGVILFIDEIHSVYGIGASRRNDNDMASMLKHYVDRTGVKVIGTTTEAEYDKYFSSDALKRRFETINVKEPTDEVMTQIIEKVVDDYTASTGISFSDDSVKHQILDIVLDSTRENHRVYRDKLCNPDLAISIIDKAFAIAQVDESESISSDHFAQSYELCDRIYENARKDAIAKLNNVVSDTHDNLSKPKEKVIKVDFNKPKK